MYLLINIDISRLLSGLGLNQFILKNFVMMVCSLKILQFDLMLFGVKDQISFSYKIMLQKLSESQFRYAYRCHATFVKYSLILSNTV